MRYPSLQFVGTCSSFQVFMYRTCNMFAVASMSDFSASAGILSGPAASPLFICLMAIPTSSTVGGVTSIRRSIGAASMSGGFNGTSRFKSSSKCSTHLFVCSSVSVIGFPSLS
ncbi:unnamed protein product [Schistosoma intercalatum]|nr:unnamed protein product [Schistosoma intercalatum]